MKEKAYKLARFMIGWPLSIAALYFIWQIIFPRSEDLLSHLKNINFYLLSAGAGCFTVTLFLRGFIWHRLLKEKGYKIPLKHAAYLWAISEFKRYIPGGVWSLVGRTILFSQNGVRKKDTGMLLVIEAQIFIFGCLIAALLSIPFLLTYFFQTLPFKQFFIPTAGIIVFVITVGYIYANKKLQTALLPNGPAMKTAFLIFISVVGRIFFGLGYYFSISSVIFLHPQMLWQLIGFFSLVTLLSYLAFVTPAGLGVREGILTVGLAKIVDLSISAFVSLFGRVILVISEIIFIMVSFLWVRIKNEKFLRGEKWIAGHPQETILFCLFWIYTIYFTITSFLRYDNFYTGRFDLGNMVQTVWNTAQGRIFVLTNPNGIDEISRLAFHADFILIFLTPFYFIWSNPKMLLFIQTIAVGLGSFFIFFIAKDILKNKTLALAFSFAFLINPSIQRANLYDFHPVTLAILFLLGAFYFYYKKKYLYFSIFAILASITKEEIWLITALFGIFFFVFQKKRLFGAAVFIISVSAFTALIWYLIPQALGSAHFALSYYSEFGDSPTQIIKTIIFTPQKIIGILLTQNRLNYLNQLFFPVGFLSLASPLFLVFTVPDLLINLLSSNSQLHQIYYQYTAPINPFIFIAAIMSVKFIKGITKIPDAYIVIYLAAISLSGAYLYGPMPGAKGSNLDMYTRQLPDREFIEKYISGIPKQMSVAASNNAGSHLSERRQIYTIPNGLGKADVVVFLLTELNTFDSERQMVNKLKQDNNYYSAVEKGKFVIFKRRGI